VQLERRAAAPAGRVAADAAVQHELAAEQVYLVRDDVRPERAPVVEHLRQAEIRLRLYRVVALGEQAHAVPLRAGRRGRDLERGAERLVVLAVVATEYERIERVADAERAHRRVHRADA